MPKGGWSADSRPLWDRGNESALGATEILLVGRRLHVLEECDQFGRREPYGEIRAEVTGFVHVRVASGDGVMLQRASPLAGNETVFPLAGLGCSLAA
jgi:hypothetical protein